MSCSTNAGLRVLSRNKLCAFANAVLLSPLFIIFSLNVFQCVEPVPVLLLRINGSLLSAHGNGLALPEHVRPQADSCARPYRCSPVQSKHWVRCQVLSNKTWDPHSGSWASKPVPSITTGDLAWNRKIFSITVTVFGCKEELVEGHERLNTVHLHSQKNVSNLKQ